MENERGRGKVLTKRGRGKVLTKICKEPRGKVKEAGLNSNKECGHLAKICLAQRKGKEGI
jgi:hypothetical protein